MKNFDKLYEGVLDRIGKSIGGAVRGGAEKIGKGAEKIAKGVEKGAKGAEKLAAKTPYLGSISKANKAIGKIEDYFNDIQDDMNDNRKSLAKLKGKADALLSKLIDVFGDDPDKEVIQLMRKLEDRSKAIQGMFQDISKVFDKAKAGREDTSYKEPAPEDRDYKKPAPKKKVRLKPQAVASSYEYNEEAINEAIDFVDVICNEIDEIIQEAKITDKKSLMDYAMTLAKKAYDKVDKKKVTDIVNNAMEKSGGEMDKAVGVVQSSITSEEE